LATLSLASFLAFEIAFSKFTIFSNHFAPVVALYSGSMWTVTVVSAKCSSMFSSICEAILCASSIVICLVKEASMFI
jgi:hypothetical protein